MQIQQTHTRVTESRTGLWLFFFFIAPSKPPPEVLRKDPADTGSGDEARH